MGTLSVDQKRDLYDRAVLRAGIELKGKNNHYTSINGNMQSFLGKDGVGGLRFSAEDRQEFMDTFSVGQPIQYSTVMKDYVEIPDSLLEDTDTLAKYLAKSHAYVAALKPKPTKK